jgi:hypothetical protein
VLADAVCADGGERARAGRVAIADSKSLYQSGGSLAPLERGVLAALAAGGARPTSWRELFDTLAPGNAAIRERLPWYHEFDLALPVRADPPDVIAAGDQLRQAFAKAGVTISCLRSQILWVPRFNELVQVQGNKATVLSQATLELVTELAGDAQTGPIRVLCDKHGGRARYAALLQEVAGTPLVQVVAESRRESCYRFGTPSRPVEIRFSTKGERFLPAALASMTSKYLRELAMLALNRYWCGQVSGLKPTAGYPRDAKRWFAAIETTKQELQIDNCLLWRSR